MGSVYEQQAIGMMQEKVGAMFGSDGDAGGGATIEYIIEGTMTTTENGEEVVTGSVIESKTLADGIIIRTELGTAIAHINAKGVDRVEILEP